VPVFLRIPLPFSTWSASILLILTWAIGAAKADSNAGTRDFSFISILNPARTMGLADANTATPEGLDAIGSNPAGLTRLESGRSVAATVRFMTVGEKGGQVAYAFSSAPDSSLTTSKNHFALSAAYLNAGDINMLDDQGNAEGEVQPSAFSPAISYARIVSDHWRVGGTLKGYQEYLGDFQDAQSALGYGIDLGLLYSPGMRNLGFGAALVNLGRKFVAHTGDGASQGNAPVALRGGLWYIPSARSHTRVTAEVQVDDGENPIFSGAGEWTPYSFFTARAGLRSNWQEMRHVWKIVSEGNAGPFYGGEARRLGVGFTLVHDAVAVDCAVQWWTDLGFVPGLTLRRGW
jgi:hypothetical protein